MVWKIILAIIVAFIVLTLIRAIFFVSKKRGINPLEPERADAGRAAKHLSEAISIPTISYPDEDMVDWSQFERFHDFLERAYPNIARVMTCEKVARAGLLYRWQGSDPSLEPIALIAHQDVVPVTEGTEGDWVHPPFSGENDGEFIWGRGSLDMKNHLICVMEAVDDLIAEGYIPERDVYICLGHNEEVVASDNSCATEIMEVLRSREVKLDSVLDEGGAILPVKVKGVIDGQLVGIGIAEKGYADIEVIVTAKGGHSAQPPKHSAVGALADVIKDIEGHQFPSRIRPFLMHLLEKIGRSVSYPVRIVTCNLWLLRPLLTQAFKLIPPAASMIRTATAVTMAQGSPAANVLPQRASVVVNFRMMPGTTVDDVVRHIKKVVKNKNIEVKVLKAKEASNFSPTDSRAFNVLEELSVAANPNSIVAPYLVMGGTDACYYEPICRNVYRFAPFVVSMELLLCTHGTNERMPLSALGDGVKFFKRYIRRMSGSK